MKSRVGIVFGGRSGEHEISVRSARNVVAGLDAAKYEIVPVAISQDGRWLSPRRSAELLGGELPDVLDVSVDGELTVFSDSRLLPDLKLDVIFPVLHGPFGEDGTIQGLFDLADIPYVGCGVLGSACGMDKVVMKSLFREAGLPMCKYLWFLRTDWDGNRDAVIRKIETTLGYPVFVKPANLGSSVGISKAIDAETLGEAIDLAGRYDRKIIVEEGLQMREIECGILGTEASLPGEYVIKNKTKAFLDFAEKYSDTGNNEFVVPSPVSEELASKIRDMAVRAFQAVDGWGLARVDFFLRSDTGALLVNEINTMPGLTEASGYPKMWEGSGVEFPKVLDTLIDLAMERHRERSKNRISRTE